MARAFSRISYTPSVRAAQARYGSREANAGFDLASDARDTVSELEHAFIPTIDTFFMATVGENGWPYVQHRGGPKGFLKILDQHTLGFADFAGNRQYISAGNIAHDTRVMLILIDFAARRRLKIWGRARIVHESEEPELVARLEMPSYRARIERAYIISVEAFDFNCPQHITPRLTEAEAEAEFMRRIGPGARLGSHAPASDRLREPESMTRLAPASATATAQAPARHVPAAVGNGELELTITAMRQLTTRIRAYELRRLDGAPFSEISAGSHLRVPVRMADGSQQTRSYSIASNPGRRDAIEIAVLREESGRGGSMALHRDFSLGMVLRCGAPRNNFPLHQDARPAILIAGGIGITPLKAMAQQLAAQQRSFFLHYTARTPQQMAYRSKLQSALQGRVAFYFSQDPSSARLDLGTVMSEAPADAVFYACGPAAMISAFQRAARDHGIDQERLRIEQFRGTPEAPEIVQSASARADRPIALELKRSRQTLIVPANQTILDTVLAAGILADFECRGGSCGACATKVLEGTPDHRDTALTVNERALASLMCICVSRAHGERLVLDL